MNFSLKRYIKEKQLNESLNSDILINEIINDTGGFFRYYKAPYKNSMYKRIQEFTVAMKDILDSLFGFFEQNPEPKIDGIPIDTDEKVKYVHKKYMEYYNKYMNTVPYVFNKTEPRIFISLISLSKYDSYISADSLEHQTTIDMFNISDDNFKTYYLKELKGNKVLKQEVLDEVNKYFVFWIDYAGKIQAVSKTGNMLLFAPDNNRTEVLQADNYKIADTGSIEDMESKVTKDNIEKNLYTYIYKLSDGESLIFPSPIFAKGYNYKSSKEAVGVQFLHFLDITQYNFHEKDRINVGKFYTAASQLQKYTDWGRNENDKLIIYKVSTPFDDGTNKSKWTKRIKKRDSDEYTYSLVNMPEDDSDQYGYNEYKQWGIYNPSKEDRVKGYEFTSKMKYKWQRDIFNKYKPYAGGKTPFPYKGEGNPIFGYERSLTDAERMNIYKEDSYCSELAYNNFRDYRYYSQRLKTIKKVNAEIKEKLKTLLNTVGEHVLKGQEWGKVLKKYKGQPEFMEIMTAFDAYMKSIGYSISQLAMAEKQLKEYIETYSAKDKVVSTGDKDNITRKYNEIIKILDNVEHFNGQLYDLDDKINELTTD